LCLFITLLRDAEQHKVDWSVSWYETLEGKLAISGAVLIVLLGFIVVRPDQSLVSPPETSAAKEVTSRAVSPEHFQAAELQPLLPVTPPPSPGVAHTPTPTESPKTPPTLAEALRNLLGGH
jgi:hypothetical protein